MERHEEHAGDVRYVDGRGHRMVEEWGHEHILLDTGDEPQGAGTDKISPLPLVVACLGLRLASVTVNYMLLQLAC